LRIVIGAAVLACAMLTARTLGVTATATPTKTISTRRAARVIIKPSPEGRPARRRSRSPQPWLGDHPVRTRVLQVGPWITGGSLRTGDDQGRHCVGFVVTSSSATFKLPGAGSDVLV
jgi:hypothetical protein